MPNETAPLTFSFSDKLNTAERIQHKFCNALEQLADAAECIEKIGPELVVYRGREFKKTDIIADFGKLIALTENIDLYLHQFSKIDTSPRI